MTRGSALLCLLLLAGACGIYGEDDDKPAPAPVLVIDTNDAGIIATSDAATGDPPVVSDQDSGLEPADASAPVDAGGDSAVSLRDLYAFTTSTKVSGKLDAFDPLSKADALCNTLAASSGTNEKLKGKTFAAWLGTATTTAKKRIADKAAGHRYILTSGDVVTNDPTTMGSKGLKTRLWLTEKDGQIESLEMVWTGVDALGATYANNCSQWATDSPGVSGLVGIVSINQGTSWTQLNSSPCDQLHRLYCFELP